MKFLGYLRIQHLHQIVLSPIEQSDHMNLGEKNAIMFAELIQFLNDSSLSLVMRNMKDDGLEALGILREHYLSKKKKSRKLFPSTPS